MNTEELFEVLDDDGNPTGVMPRSRVHREGCWHRAANVFLFRSDGQLLIQRRQDDKDTWPGAWDVSVAEHLKPGESHEAGAIRGLQEELGITGVPLVPVGGIRRVCVEIPEAGIRDRELQQSFAGVHDGPWQANPVEVGAVEILPLAELYARVAAQPEHFTPWFRQSLQELHFDVDINN